MKAIIEKTGQTVNVELYIERESIANSVYRVTEWLAGNTFLGSELTFLTDEQEEDKEHWQDVRERAAIAAMQGLISNRVYADYIARKSRENGFKFSDAVSEDAIEMANALVKQLKGK